MDYTDYIGITIIYGLHFFLSYVTGKSGDHIWVYIGLPTIQLFVPVFGHMT